jgi:hypothetical protein
MLRSQTRRPHAIRDSNVEPVMPLLEKITGSLGILHRGVSRGVSSRSRGRIGGTIVLKLCDRRDRCARGLILKLCDAASFFVLLRRMFCHTSAHRFRSV